MSNERANRIAQTAELILTTDDLREVNDAFKLSPTFRATLEDRLREYRRVSQNLNTATGQRSGDAERVKSSHPRLTQRMRDGFRFLQALPDFRVTDAQKLTALRTYGFDGNKTGSLERKERVLELARVALAVTPSINPPEARYPADLLGEIEKELQILDQANAGSRIGNRSAATQARDRALQELSKAVSRVRAYYIFASDDLDATPELAKIGMNPTRRTGQRKVQTESNVQPPPGTLPPVTPN